jgi:ADP-heptose:LPS heptosyltransferase
LPIRILVLRRGGLGDTLLVLPLLAALRRAHRAAELCFAGAREFGEVLVAFGACDRALSGEDLALWSPEQARRRLQGCDLVVGDEPALAQVAIDPRRVLPGVPFGLQLARQAGFEPVWPDDAWFAPPAPARANGPLVLAPGSGGRRKCWPRERWCELLARLADPVAVVVGPAEAERDDPRSWPWPRPPAFLAGMSAVELAHHLAAARGCVGNDSGPTHLAACLRVPTVAIFGPTDPAVWAPPGAHVRVVGEFGCELAAIGVDEVAAALA